MEVERKMKYNNHIQEQELIDYVLGNLSAKKQIDVTQHTEQCRECNKALQSWQQVLCENVEAEPSSELKSRIWQSVEKEQQPRKVKKKPAFTLGLSSIAVVLCLIIGTYFYNKSVDPSVAVVQ